MGNCLQGLTSSADGVSLLRGGSETPPPSLEPQSSSDLQLHTSSSSSGLLQGPPPSYEESMPMYHPTPNVTRPASQLTEEEQVKIAKRIGLIQHLPTGTYDGCKKNRECVICMVEFMVGDSVRYLPCMHTYHVECIDDWLMRSFTCPSCMEPVESALLSTYEANWPSCNSSSVLSDVRKSFRIVQ